MPTFTPVDGNGAPTVAGEAQGQETATEFAAGETKAKVRHAVTPDTE